LSVALVIALAGLLTTMALAVIRAAAGPTVFDRILAANAFGTQTVLLIAVSGFYSGRPEWLDLAIVYALMNFIGVIAVCKFTRYGNLADDSHRGSAS
jgi:multicomponent Na+:H+ antiporter subunit F